MPGNFESLPNPLVMTDELCRAILAYTDSHPGTNGVVPTEIPGLVIVRGDAPTTIQRVFYEPALIFVLQGAKDVSLGGASFAYGAGAFLIMSVGMPVLSKITQASRERPYLALAFAIDLGLVDELRREIDVSQDAAPHTSRLGLFVGRADARQRETLARLTPLLASPQAVRVLGPGLVREIVYWTMTGREGTELRRLAAPDTHARRIAEAIAVLREAYTETVSIERLAAIAQMSPSAFHLHFKAMTSISPLQYQKQLRLLEARRLMLTGGADATRAAYRVGYESASQFSREYARMFGDPPRRDLAKNGGAA